MRTSVYCILLLYVAFLVAPTIVSVVNKTSDTSNFYNFAEEELAHKAIKEVKLLVLNDYSFKLAQLTSSVIISENQLKHDTITLIIFSPPPNA